MKRTALTHTKMKRLSRMLDIPQWGAVGIMESLWNLTAKETPTGQIGKLSNEDIAMQLDWRGNADELVQSLLASGWLDINEELRLLVHDWHDHADNSVHTALARRCERFASGEIPKSGELNKHERERFNKWLEAQGADRRPAGRPVENQPKTSANPDKTSLNPVQNHVPVPLPVPCINTPPSRAQDAETPEPPQANDGLPPEGLGKLQYATWLLEQVGLPDVFATKMSASAAIGTFERTRKVPDHIATVKLRDLAVAARARGEPVNKFWLEDPNKWEPKGGGNGANTGNRAQERVGNTVSAIREAAKQRGWENPDAASGADGGAVSASGPSSGNAGVSSRLREAGAAVHTQARDGGLGGTTHPPRPKILPPA